MKNQSIIANPETIRRLLLVILVAVPFAFSSALCQAQIIVQHAGQNDPLVDEGWGYNPIGTGPNSLTPGNDGVDYWDINCTGSGSLYYHDTLPSSDFTDPSGWTATLYAKVNEADAADLRAILSAADGNGNSWAYSLGGGGTDPVGVFYLDPNATATPISTSVNPTSGYHYYQIIYPGSGGSGTADFYVDGMLGVTLTRAQALGSGTSTDSGIYWGGVSSGPDSSDVQYAEVTLEYGSHPYVPPSTILSQSPAPNGVNISPGTAVTITLLDGSTPVLTNEIQLYLNNVAVSPTISKPSNTTTINYQPPGNLALSSTNTVTLVFNDTASTLATNTWSFTVASQNVIVEHTGQNDPATEGFSVYRHGVNFAGGNDGVSNFWDVSSPSGGSGDYTATLTPLDFADPSGWTVTASEKVIRANNENGGNNNNFVAAVDGTNAWIIILQGGSGVSAPGVYADDANVNLLQLSSAVDPTVGYRKYQMVYNPTNQTVSYYVDGYFVTGVTRSQVYPLSGDGEFLQWGDGTSFNPPEDSRYALVELQAGQQPIAPVFFPNTIQSQNPGVNGVNVSPTASVTVDLASGTGPINTNQIQLSVNGVPVTPTITTIATNNTIPAAVVTQVSYTPPAYWALNSVNTLTLVFNDTASTLVTNTWSFTVASQLVIAEHIGLNDPTTEGFSLYNHGENLAGGNDGVSNFWDISSPSGGSGYYTASLTPSAFSDPSGWTVTASEKVIRANNENGGNNNNFVAVVDGTNAWLIILQGGSGVSAPGLYADDPNVNLLQISSAVDPTIGYRTYQMVYNPTNQTVSYYVDGYFVTGVTRSQIFPLSGDGEFLQWGDGTSFSPPEDTQYALVELQAGQQPIAPVFFPNTIYSQSPAANAVNVPPNAPITITLESGSGPVLTNEVQLIVNGAPVAPTFAIVTNTGTVPASAFTTVSYTPPADWALSSSNNVTVVFNDSADTLVTNTWGFTVASQFVIIEHVGQNNPNTEGFSFTGANVGVVPGNDGVSNYWELYTVPGGYGYYTAPLTTADFTDPSGWTVTVSEELIRAYNSDGGNNNNFVAVVDGQTAWLIILGGGSGVPASATGLFADDLNVNPLQLSSTVDPTSGYLTYQMVYNPANQVVSYYVDGRFVASLTRSQTFALSGDGEFMQFGDGTTANPTSDTKYAFIELQAGQHPIAPPPPPTLALSQTGANLNFSWSGAGFVLQTNGNLSNPSGWADLPGGTVSPQVVPIGAGDLFFRLGQQ